MRRRAGIALAAVTAAAVLAAPVPDASVSAAVPGVRVRRPTH
jgi:hypothetical protein